VPLDDDREAVAAHVADAVRASVWRFALGVEDVKPGGPILRLLGRPFRPALRRSVPLRHRYLGFLAIGRK
jgi:hypothetical protein